MLLTFLRLYIVLLLLLILINKYNKYAQMLSVETLRVCWIPRTGVTGCMRKLMGEGSLFSLFSLFIYLFVFWDQWS